MPWIKTYRQLTLGLLQWGGVRWGNLLSCQFVFIRGKESFAILQRILQLIGVLQSTKVKFLGSKFKLSINMTFLISTVKKKVILTCHQHISTGKSTLLYFFVCLIHLGVELWCTCTFGRGSEETLSFLYFCRLFWLYLTNSSSNVLWRKYRIKV